MYTIVNSEHMIYDIKFVIEYYLIWVCDNPTIDANSWNLAIPIVVPETRRNTITA